MARNRMLKPEFWEDEDLAKLSPENRLFYIASWNFADDNGILNGSSRWLIAKVFPYDENITTENIEDYIFNLSNMGKFYKYQVDGRDYIYILNFRKHQRIVKPCPSSAPLPENYKHLDLGQSLTQTVRLDVYERDKYVCQYCGLDLSDKPKLQSIDHIIPLMQLGSNMNNNLVTCCKSCNSKKQNRTPEDANMRFIDGRDVSQYKPYSQPTVTPMVDVGSTSTSPKIKEVKLSEVKLNKEEVEEETPATEILKTLKLPSEAFFNLVLTALKQNQERKINPVMVACKVMADPKKKLGTDEFRYRTWANWLPNEKEIESTKKGKKEIPVTQFDDSGPTVSKETLEKNRKNILERFGPVKTSVHEDGFKSVGEILKQTQT